MSDNAKNLPPPPLLLPSSSRLPALRRLPSSLPPLSTTSSDNVLLFSTHSSKTHSSTSSLATSLSNDPSLKPLFTTSFSTASSVATTFINPQACSTDRKILSKGMSNMQPNDEVYQEIDQINSIKPSCEDQCCQEVEQYEVIDFESNGHHYNTCMNSSSNKIPRDNGRNWKPPFTIRNLTNFSLTTSQQNFFKRVSDTLW